jgi:hypothetical protein
MSSSIGRSLRLAAAATAIIAASPLAGTAQAAGERAAWTITPMYGLFAFDFADDENFPIYAVRADRPTGKWTRVELETSYSRPDVQADAAGIYDPDLPTEQSHFVTLSLGIQGRYRIGLVEPYAGVSFGFFFRRDDEPEGLRFSRSTFGFPAGLRVFVTDRIGLRGEFRIRRDQSTIGAPSFTNIEKTVGLSYTF